MLLPSNVVNAPLDATGETMPVSVPAGGSVTVREIIDLTQEPPGPVNKSLFVFLHGQDNFAATYTINGTLAADVTMVPRVLDFGAQNPDKPTSIKVTVTIDKRLSPSGFPALTSNNEDLKIIPQTIVDTAQPAGIGKPAGHILTRTYTVSPSDNMPLGDIRGALSLTPTKSSPEIAASEFQSAQSIVTGTVLGNVKAQPDFVTFGSLTYGQGGQQTIMLSSDNLADITNVKAVSKSPYITVTPGIPDAPSLDTLPVQTASAHHVYLQVTMDRKAPTGLIDTEIKIVLANGHRLLIHVDGYIAMLPQ